MSLPELGPDPGTAFGSLDVAVDDDIAACAHYKKQKKYPIL